MLFLKDPGSCSNAIKLRGKKENNSLAEYCKSDMSTYRFVLREIKDSSRCTAAGMVPGPPWLRSRFCTSPRYGRIFRPKISSKKIM